MGISRATQRRNHGTTGYVVVRYIDTVYPIHKWRSCHRDTHTTIQNNIYLGNQIVKKHNIVRENKTAVRTG